MDGRFQFLFVAIKPGRIKSGKQILVYSAFESIISKFYADLTVNDSCVVVKIDVDCWQVCIYKRLFIARV